MSRSLFMIAVCVSSKSVCKEVLRCSLGYNVVFTLLLPGRCRRCQPEQATSGKCNPNEFGAGSLDQYFSCGRARHILQNSQPSTASPAPALAAWLTFLSNLLLCPRFLAKILLFCSQYLGSEILEFLDTCFSLTDEDLLLLFSYLCFCFPFLEQPFPSPRLRPGSRSAPPDMYLEIVILLKTLFHLAAASLIFIDHADAARRGRFLIPWYTILFIAARPGEGYDLDLKSQGELRIFFYDSRNLIQG